MKKQPKVTDWFPAHVKPVRDGLYESHLGIFFYWVSKRGWFVKIDGGRFGELFHQDVIWRGLAINPEKAK